MKQFILILVVTFFLSSCASILNPEYQKVTIHAPQGNKLLINNKKPKKKNGKYLLKRDLNPVQITVEKEGHKSVYKTVMQYKKSFLHIFSWIPFGITLYAPLYDVGPKSWNYEKEIKVPKSMIEIPIKAEGSKDIRLNKVAIDMDASDMVFVNYDSYKYYLKSPINATSRTKLQDDDIQLNNTIFTDVLNDILKEKGYIDTTRKVIKDSYLNNIYINATITRMTFTNVSNIQYVNPTNRAVDKGFIFSKMKMKWEALDYYKQPIFTMTTNTKSGEYAYTSEKKRAEKLMEATKDAIEIGLIEFMKADTVISLLNDRSDEEVESSFTDFLLPENSDYVSNLNEAIKSSVTIKCNDGHGSGFIVSSNGHIITNYHVVSDTVGLKVVLNDESEHDVEILRTSKIYDLALLKIDKETPKPFKLSNNKEFEIAQDIYAVGTPNAQDLSQSVSKGIISGVRKTEKSKLIQTDASINSGNSGGAIVNKQGVVLGIVGSKLKGIGIEGVAFGIPAYEVTEKLKVIQQ